MKTIAIIGASFMQRPLVEKAKQMGLRSICFAWSDGAICKDICDKFYDISIIEKDAILEICKKERIDGICTIASDVAAPTVAYVAEKMGLTGNTYESAVRANNKFLMRNALAKAGVSCPQYLMVTSCDQADTYSLQYPLIVKPSDRSGSAGVSKVERAEDLIPAVERSLKLSFKHESMIEEFIDGREISVEFISYKGKHYPLQITDKVTTGAPHFVELEHHQPSSLSHKMFSKIYEITENALNVLELTNGASHSEYKITQDGRIAVMEIGGRMGGDFIGSDLVPLSTGYDFLRGVIEVSLGFFKVPVRSFNKYSGVFFLSKETEYLSEIIKNRRTVSNLVTGEIYEENLKNVTCSADRSGYLIYQSDKKLNLH